MFNLLLLVALFAGCVAHPNGNSYFYRTAVGTGRGQAFSSHGENGVGGRIRAIRVYEYPGSYISGLQVKYEHETDWSTLMGRTYGNLQELELFEDEVIVQVSGKYNSNYIYQVIFVTSRGRLLTAGQPVTNSFNMYPNNDRAELILLSGHFNGGGITSLASHWAVFSDEEEPEGEPEEQPEK